MSKEKLEDIIASAKIGEILRKKDAVEEKSKKNCNCILIILAIIGGIAAVAGIAYAVYRYFTPDYLEDFEDDFDDDDFEDDFEDETDN